MAAPLFLLPLLFAQTAAVPPIVPKPVSIQRATGPDFEITRDTVLVDESKTPASRIFSDMFKRASGFSLKSGNRRTKAKAIYFDPRAVAGLKPGAYEITVNDREIHLRFSDNNGAFYAVETLRQLLPPEIESKKGNLATPWRVPAITIKDEPRYPWRGMLLDVSRHFFSVDFIKRYIDYLSMFKMNVFHWHLTDDGGWRIQIDKYPKLTQVGAWRYGITDGWDQSKLRFDQESHLPKYGGFYTKKQVRDVVKYAMQRGVTIVPEIEMPGHAMAVFAAYPELGCKNLPPAAQAGQPNTDVYCAGNEQTFTFIQDVLMEVMDLFPSKWIHIGGDEVYKGYWHACPLCQERIRTEGLKNEEELQSYFIRRIDKFLTDKGRRMIGWDEILEGGLAQGATVMSWRGIEGGIAAASSGHDVVMSPTSHSYFDYSYASIGTDQVYGFDPTPAALDPSSAHYILGGQANLWTEWVPTEARAEYLIFPRMIAMAEALWSPKDQKDLPGFQWRLGSMFGRLDRMGVSYYLPAPAVDFTAVLFQDSTLVTATVDPSMPATLRFTVDGTDPTVSSTIYTEPIHVIKDCDVKFAFVTSSGRIGEVTTVQCRQTAPQREVSAERGWTSKYYEGKFGAVPDFGKLTPVSMTVVDHLSSDPDGKSETWAKLFHGNLKVEEDGVYSFNLTSDDGSWLKIGGATVINHDGPHGSTTKTGRVRLTKGYYPMDVGYYQEGGAASLRLTVAGPGAGEAGAVDSRVYRDR